jgi:methionyl-tRNA formyltransferase
MAYPPRRIAYAGTPEFAAVGLQVLIDAGHRPEVVYTQPDRPAGRGRRLIASPVKQLAERFDIPVRQPEKMGDAEAQQLRAEGIELMVVVAYGQILPRGVLNAPTLGCWNLHASLLPRWRGAAPIQRAIDAGDTVTGVCLMQMAVGLDTGPVLAKWEEPIHDTDTAGSLHDRLARAGASLLVDVLAKAQVPAPREQSQQGVSYARKLTKAEAALDFTQAAADLARQVRAFQPFPIATFEFQGQRWRVHAAQALAEPVQGAVPGTLISANDDGLDVATADGVLRLTKVQRPGAKPMLVADLLNGVRDLQPGVHFD